MRRFTKKSLNTQRHDVCISPERIYVIAESRLFLKRRVRFQSPHL